MNYIHKRQIHNTKAAKEIVPIVLDIFEPKSVIDVGCGLGSWLRVFQNYGVKDLLGIDSPYLDTQLLEISSKLILERDLEEPLIINRKFDLLLCLEVIEHLSVERAESFIKEIVSISDVIIFSAAIPGQGGQNHFNEQYADYWVRLFNKCGFIVLDLIRPRIWNNTNVDWWYRQNIIVFINQELSDNKLKYILTGIKHIEPLISRDLYEIKISEFEELLKNYKAIISGEKHLKFYVRLCYNYCRRILNKFR